MITTLPGLQSHQAGLGGQAAAGHRRRRSSTRTARTPAPSRGCLDRCAGRGRRCCARSTATTSASSRPTGRQFGRDVYFVGDAARQDEDGYFWIIGRVDDVINVSGHRMSTAEIESAIVSHEKVAEAAVIGQADEDTRPVGHRLRDARGRPRGRRRPRRGRSASTSPSGSASSRGPSAIIWADDLPKTRSGKIMRRLLRDIAEGRELGDVTTLRDPDVMKQLEGRCQEE